MNEELINRIVRVSPDATTLIGGVGFPSNSRDTDMYISRVCQNGTVEISYSDRCLILGYCFPNDLIVTNKVREGIDDIEEEPLFEARVFGVSERMENIEITKRRLKLPDDQVIIDAEHIGCKPTAQKTWSLPAKKEYVCVLPDDVELCDNFVHYCNCLLKAYGDSVISLFPIHFMRRDAISRMPRNPYVWTKGVSGAGIIMPADWVKPCLDAWRDDIIGDDTNIEIWAIQNKKKIITTIPALVQHIGDLSVHDARRSIGRTHYYRKDVSGSDWNDTYLNLWNNISRD
jgi:hypothetical protein